MAKRKPVVRKSSSGVPPKAPTGDGKVDLTPFNAGRTTKDSNYLQRIKAATMSTKHPRNNGVAMQAHHVISATGMHKSGLAEKIRVFGYNINTLDNLVFIPCTLQGACHLGVQPHRGNHNSPAENEDNYANDQQPFDYHDLVQNRIKDLKMGLTKDCPGFMGGAQESAARHKVRTELDNAGKQILAMIQKRPRAAPLTAVAAHFQPGSLIGCAGVDVIRQHSAVRQCAVGRHHHGNQGPGQKAEGIKFDSNGNYKLEMGQ
jgi:hypothetical protein